MARTPTATYGLRAWSGAGELAGYLAALGVSHVRTPLPGADPEGFRAMAAHLRAHGLGVVLDISSQEPPERLPKEVHGLRVHHPDRLADPAAYLRRLAREWIVVGKLLDETPPGWPCAGTTGNDAVGMAGGVFVDPAGEKPLTETYTRLTGGPEDFTEVERTARRLALDERPDDLAATLARILPG